jgi:hypothetical protein
LPRWELRPCIYSNARNEALRRSRERPRDHVSDTLPDTESSDPGPEMLAARTELAELIAELAADCPIETARCWSWPPDKA